MLNLLHIENIAVIECADISFDRGFNILTGETGAGKSIVVDAVNLVLGERADRDLIANGKQKARVEAVCKAVDGAIDAVVDLQNKTVTVSGAVSTEALKKASSRKRTQSGERLISKIGDGRSNVLSAGLTNIFRGQKRGYYDV